MLIPSKHEKLDNNTLVVGADIISLLKRGHLSIESIFDSMKIKKSVTLDDIYYSILFLWLSELVILDENLVKLKVEK